MDRVLNFIEKFFKNSKGELNILGKGIKIIIIFIIIRILIKIAYVVIDRTMNRRKKGIFYADEKKINTLSTVLKNIIKYIFYFIGLVMVLDMFNISTSSILATAGIGGLAIGFGAQSLVKDIITGFFILFEDQFSVGDYVKIGEYEGIVEELGVRVTKIRDFSGELHIIPNSNIGAVTNRTRGAMRALVKVSVAYEEDIDQVINILDRVCKEIRDTNENIVDGPTILGISDLGEYGVDLTIVAKTNPMDQWGVEREIRKKVKEALDKANIEIPYPKRVIYDNKS
ncbi:mechanosensitive ion channel family protein [Clostridium sp. Cult3]|uniref:mechanosensitive ion channel family protein n=1 Tax=Clostridium sp. Cult3 TaxID=2079004 RepID=UPI001F39C45F|nr:mechanosensitive ion channel family protein [Clostridium sp. Cult3]MCF6460972.1 mechanosensitive ion channel protein MscS [Clostridium sp. Cult3]